MPGFTPTTARRYGFQFRKVNHLVRYSIDEHTGEYRSEVLPCDSATCSALSASNGPFRDASRRCAMCSAGVGLGS